MGGCDMHTSPLQLSASPERKGQAPKPILASRGGNGSSSGKQPAGTDAAALQQREPDARVPQCVYSACLYVKLPQQGS